MLMKKRQVEQEEAELRAIKRRELFEPFPHPRSPFTQDLPQWIEAGAYFVMYGDTRGMSQRLLHSGCEGTKSSALKPQAHQFSLNHPVIVLDLSACPVLMEEDEWPHTIISTDSTYRDCTCSFGRYLMDEKDTEVKREYYRMTTPYFYLCDFNKAARNDEYGSCFSATLLPHEKMARNVEIMRKAALVQ